MPDTKTNPQGSGVEDMASIFSSLKQYAGKWALKSKRALSPAEIAEVDSAEVVSSDYGSSVCFHMRAGGMMFLPVSTESTLKVGQTVDLANVNIITLSKQGEQDIQRVE